MRFATEDMLVIPDGLTAKRIEYYFKDRGSGNWRCSSCGSLVWHSDAPMHAMWHATQANHISWAALDPEDKQYVILVYYCNGQYAVDPHPKIGKDYVERMRDAQGR
jgi:hypothetical protein